MKIVYSCDNIEILEYKPTILKPFYCELEPTTFMRRLRFGIELIYGYKVFYLKVDDEIVGYCTITSGKNPRYWFANEDDIIVGPYYIKEEYRRRGLTSKIVDFVINGYCLNWMNAYLYILNSNVSSIYVAEKLGGEKLFQVHNNVFRRLVKSDKGEYGIYCIKRSRI